MGTQREFGAELLCSVYDDWEGRTMTLLAEFFAEALKAGVSSFLLGCCTTVLIWAILGTFKAFGFFAVDGLKALFESRAQVKVARVEAASVAAAEAERARRFDELLGFSDLEVDPR
jgi:hypothetical protein